MSFQSEELLHYHYKFGHTSFAKLKTMASKGIIPKYLANALTPKYMACMYSQATRKQSLMKRMKDWTDGSKARFPGYIASVDQLISPTLELIAQTTGSLMKAKYKLVTICVDQYSGYEFVHSQRSHGAKETLESKTAFVAISIQYGLRIDRYHADNGVFRSYEWIKDYRRCKQHLTFAGVQVYQTNGKAERRIRYLQDRARSMIIHA